MPRGVSKKRERQYEELKTRFEDEGRYPGREEEVAARIVNKQRAQSSETQAARQEDREGRSPDRNLPLDDYDHLTVPQVLRKAGALSLQQVQQILTYERNHRRRKTLIERLDRKIRSKR